MSVDERKLPYTDSRVNEAAKQYGIEKHAQKEAADAGCHFVCHDLEAAFKAGAQFAAAPLQKLLQAHIEMERDQRTERSDADPQKWMGEFVERYDRETQVTCENCGHTFTHPVYERGKP